MQADKQAKVVRFSNRACAKFPGKASHESWIIGNYDVFVVFGGGRAGPIVAAGEEKILVGDGKFVVHVGRWSGLAGS